MAAWKLARKYFKVIGLEDLSGERQMNMHTCIKCGADYVTVFQETYNSDKYETLHLAGHKRIFPYRDQCTGACADGRHARRWPSVLCWDWMISGRMPLQRDMHAYVVAEKISARRDRHFPVRRLRPIINNDRINPMDVHEPQLLQVVCAYRSAACRLRSIAVSSRRVCESAGSSGDRSAATKSIRRVSDTWNRRPCCRRH